MLQKLSVGPPMVGAADLKSFADNATKKDFKGSGSESSFGKALEDRMTSRAPKDAKDSPQKEIREKENPDVPEAKGKKAETEVARPEGKNKKANGRQQAIKDFMDSFESEFEIPPTRLVEAMAQLDDTQLAQSPEDTAEAVVEQLGLNEADSDKAQAMYASLLMQLNQMPTAAKAVPVIAVGAGLSHESAQARILASQGKQDMVSASVDRLNQKFWGGQAKPTTEAMMPSLDQTLGQNLSIDESSFKNLPGVEVNPEMASAMPTDLAPPTATPAPGSALKDLPPHLQGQMSESISPALLAALAAKQAAGKGMASGEESAEPELMGEFQQALQGPGTEKLQSGLSQGPQAVQSKMNPEQFQNFSQEQSFGQNSQGMMSKGATVTKESEIAKGIEKSGEFSQSLTGLEGIHGAPIKGELLKAETAAPLAAGAGLAAAATPAEHEAAVKQVMTQANYLIKKGGGEMKVEMSPEGMGTIHLKVMLQDGKVNMQMSADTAEAKKTIESSLAELKTSLAAHKLSMENVKVDVVNSVSTDTATQNQTNLNGQGQQQKETRQFWNQFNENFGSQERREAFSSTPNLKTYGKSRDPLQAIENATQGRSVEGKGRGLNLVA